MLESGKVLSEAPRLLSDRTPSPSLGRASGVRRPRTRWLAILLATFVAVLMAAPGTSAMFVSATSATASPPAHAPTSAPAPAPLAPTVAPTTGLAGQSPVGEPRISVASLLKQTLSTPGVQAIRASLKEGTASPVSPTAPRPSTAPVRAAPLAGAADYGEITGTVVTFASPHTPVSGAAVSAEPVTGFCPPQGCVPVETGAHGQFTVNASIGENVVLISNAYFLTNRTWAYVTSGGYINVGTIELVEDGFVSGVVRGDDPAHEPVPAINVSAISRDGSISAYPSSHTDGSGAFTVAVPPFPSEIQFSPIFQYAPYEPNSTFVNVTSGQSINIGTVYLEKMTNVYVTIDDSTTHQPIVGLPQAIEVCSRATGYCPAAQGSASGYQPGAQAPVGPDVVSIFVDGYVENQTTAVVPVTRPDAAPINLGTVDVVPGGGIQMWVNLTGLPVGRGQNDPSSVWPIGEYSIITNCNLDGLALSTFNGFNVTSSLCGSYCVPPESQEAILTAPLRNYLTVEPDESGCLFPGYPTWPIPEDLPVFDNHAWANVTPDLLTNLGSFNLLTGTYIEGQATPASESGWTVSACSMDEPNICGPGVQSDQSYYGDYRFEVPANCVQPGDTNASTTFCVPAPPGPVEIRVTPSNTSQNYTWAYNPPLSWPELPLPLASADEDHSNIIGLVSAVVTGRVLQGRSSTPVIGLPAVEVCPAGTIPNAVICGTGVVNSTGYFSAPAPFGWDVVTASAPQYRPNSTWVYVEKQNSTGTIYIDPYGYVNGQVVNAGGVGLYEATVLICPVTSPNSCNPVGSDGLTSTDGRYYGAAPAGPLPVGSYEVKASATGYTTDWTWVNITTPGENFTAPTIILATTTGNTTGGGMAPAARETSRTPASAPATGAGAWVVGRVIDSIYGIGLPNAGIIAAPISGAPPIIISSLRGTGGEFNDSLAAGTYILSFESLGYYTQSSFLNVSGNASVVSVGTIGLVPFPTVTGRLVIDPESWANAVTLGMGLGPGTATVSICTNQATVCAPQGIVSTSGNFNASAPAGTYDLVTGAGTGGGPGTASNGFIDNLTFVNVTNGTASTSLPNLFGLAIFGVVIGTIVNANATSAANLPVRYDQITFDTTYPVDFTQAEELTAEGTYTMIFPESYQLNITAGGLGTWIEFNETVNPVGGYHNGSFVLEPGATITLAPISLEHYGYADLKIVDNSTGRGIPYASASAAEKGYLWGLPTYWSASGDANGAGFLNLSVPPSIPAFQPLVKVVVSAPDFSSTNFSIEVNASATTYANSTGYSTLKPIKLLPWGWVTGAVQDAVTGRPLPQVSISLTVKGTPYGKSGVESNGLGLYRIDAPPSPNDTVAMSLLGYSQNRSVYNVTYGSQEIAKTVHLTGDAIVAGRVVSDPGSVPVAGATVTVCPAADPNCSLSVTTNATGIFWMTATPGLDSIHASAAGYVANSTAFVRSTSDAWVWAGVISIQQYAYVTGTVIGLPIGLALSGANASLCAPAPSGIGAGPCFTTVLTEPDGHFFLEAPAGSYVLDANATEYNDTYLSVSLVPGELLPVGNIFVQQYGTATGAIYGADTDQPAPGGTVVACESWGSGACFAPIPTDSQGAFIVTGPPGPYQLEASATGYQTAFQAVTLQSGASVAVPTFLLIPIGPNREFTVSGTVRLESNPGLGVPGAVVTATGGFGTSVSAYGTYSLSLPWGNYTLTVSAPGFVTQTRDVDVTANLANVDFLIGVQTYAVSGIVRDGLKGTGIGNVSISEGTTVLGVSASNGAYSVELANGTHDLVAAGGAPYTNVSFSVAVSGAPVSFPITLYPPAVLLDGLVVNSLSGLPLESVAVTISGTTSDGTTWSANAMSGADGRFVVSAYPGTYTAVGTLNGYSSAHLSVVVGAASSSEPLTLPLPPMSTSAAASPANAWMWAALGGIAAAGVAAVIVFIGRRFRGPPALGAPRSGKQS